MSSLKIADNHDNEAGLLQFHQLNSPMFYDVQFIAAEGILTEWHSWVSRELDGNRQPVTIGLPWGKWILYHVSRAELTWFVANFGPLVTITTLDKRSNTYKNFNATMFEPELVDEAEWDGLYWKEARFTFWDLE